MPNPVLQLSIPFAPPPALVIPALEREGDIPLVEGDAGDAWLEDLARRLEAAGISPDDLGRGNPPAVFAGPASAKAAVVAAVRGDLPRQAEVPFGPARPRQLVIDFSMPPKRALARLQEGVHVQAPNGRRVRFVHSPGGGIGQPGDQLVIDFSAAAEGVVEPAPPNVRRVSYPSSRISIRGLFPWAGSKERLIPAISGEMPPSIDGDYFEPFAGSLRVFFGAVYNEKRLVPGHSVYAADMFDAIVRFYSVVRDEDALPLLISEASSGRYANDEETYYRIRQEFNRRRLERGFAANHTLFGSPADHVVEGAEIYYLMKAAYRGVPRENSRGEFNTPYGFRTVFNMPDEAALRAAHTALAGVNLMIADYRAVLEMPKAGDFVYLDPPYIPLNGTAFFTDYTKSPFGQLEQWWLAQILRGLDRRGIMFLLSNANVPWVRDLYDGFRIVEVTVPRAMQQKGPGRQPVVKEILVRNY